MLLAVLASNVVFLVTSVVLFFRFFVEKHHRIVEQFMKYVPKQLSSGRDVSDASESVEGANKNMPPQDLTSQEIELACVGSSDETGANTRNEKTADAHLELPDGWSEHYDEEGDKYYYNSDRNLTQWEFPTVTSGDLRWISNPAI